MKLDVKSQNFIESLAKAQVGRDLIEYLKQVEIFYADIRNLGQISAEVRIDALKMFRESLLDKLLVLSGQIDTPDNDEFR